MKIYQQTKTIENLRNILHGDTCIECKLLPMKCNVSDISGSNQFSYVLFYIRFNTFAFFINVQGGCQRLYCGTRLVNISFHCLRQVVELSERHFFSEYISR